MNKSLAWFLVIFGACCFALAFGLVSGFFLGQQYPQQGGTAGSSGPAWPFALPSQPKADGRSSADPEALARHPFWKVKRTPDDINALIDLILKQKGNSIVGVSDSGKTVVSDSPQVNSIYRDREIGATVWHQHYGGQLGKEYFKIDTRQWAIQPTREDVLGDLRAALDVANYHPH